MEINHVRASLKWACLGVSSKIVSKLCPSKSTRNRLAFKWVRKQWYASSLRRKQHLCSVVLKTSVAVLFSDLERIPSKLGVMTKGWALWPTTSRGLWLQLRVGCYDRWVLCPTPSNYYYYHNNANASSLCYHDLCLHIFKCFLLHWYTWQLVLSIPL